MPGLGLALDLDLDLDLDRDRDRGLAIALSFLLTDQVMVENHASWMWGQGKGTGLCELGADGDGIWHGGISQSLLPIGKRAVGGT